ncbi:feruloyl esterase [Bryocella elongata]|uniref:Feruloyl esterase n=1 Tax=Bryocella elongata TaxID=863522 RepID=A0A1H5WCA0_9BACT|nr:tannase/feruloyl esterase family alpha/beta hydrolase [Bryocella elongata]SEF96886.1 feruloyl esterase [Bryocella elongata]
MKRANFVVLAAAVFAVVAPIAALAQTGPEVMCLGLQGRELNHARVVTASFVLHGEGLEAAKLPPTATGSLPAFCRVQIEDRPSADSDIRTEVWLPVAWNGKFRGQGNGGFAGNIDYPGLAAAVAEGYASGGTDTGHVGGLPNFALGHPEKVKDFGWRAVHDMTVQGKALATAFYAKPVAHSYFTACSDGGREALMEVERFPQDYDGVLAGAPAYNWSGLLSGGAAGEQRMHASTASEITAAQLPMIAKAALAACDAKDGLADGVLSDPAHCGFDPATLACKQGQTDTAGCLTPEQVATLRGFYSPKLDASGKTILPGSVPGAEDAPGGWDTWVAGDKALGIFYSQGYFRNFVYEKPDWQLASFDLDHDYKLATAKTGADLNSTSTAIQPFLSHGKLILYHGWADPAIPALGTVDYYNGVISTVGQKAAAESTRLYMVPGMLHCGGGPGATVFGQAEYGPRGDAQHDVFTALEQWVESGTAPGTLVATKLGSERTAPKPVMTRPLCVYPQTPVYKSGNANDANSFSCIAP